LSEVTLRELGAVRLRDLTEPEHVYQVVHPGLRAQFPALRSLEARATFWSTLAEQLFADAGSERAARPNRGPQPA